MYAVIRERGKQYKVEPGNIIEIDLKDDAKKVTRWSTMKY